MTKEKNSLLFPSLFLTTKKSTQYLVFITALTSSIVHCAQTTLSSIIDCDNPTAYTVHFQNESPTLYPANIAAQLNNKLVCKKSHVVDLTSMPEITRKKFNTFIALMHSAKHISKDDRTFLNAITTADALLETNHPTHITLLKELMERVLSKEKNSYREKPSQLEAFFRLFTNQHAQIFLQKLQVLNQLSKKSARSSFMLSRYGIHACDEFTYDTRGVFYFPYPNLSQKSPVLIELDDLMRIFACSRPFEKKIGS